MFVDSAYFTESTIAKLLRCAPQVANLYIIRGSVDIHDLAQLQRLRRLELADCSVVGSPSSSLLRLPQLQRLSLLDCLLEDSPLHFLAPAFLPQLRRFDTDDLDIAAPLIHQLEIILRAEGYDDYELLARGTSLLLLPLPDDPDERSEMFFQLPSLPPFLHINIAPVIVAGQPNNNQELVAVLEDLLERKKPGLRVILLNDYGIDDSIKSVIQQFKERGVRVQMVHEDSYFDEAVAEMEKIREKEKRTSDAGEGEANERRRRSEKAMMDDGRRELMGNRRRGSVGDECGLSSSRSLDCDGGEARGGCKWSEKALTE